MQLFKKISTLSFSAVITIIPNFALANTNPKSQNALNHYKTGLVAGSINTLCILYKTDYISESLARKLIATNLKTFEIYKVNDKFLENRIYNIFDKKDSISSSCKKLFPK